MEKEKHIGIYFPSLAEKDKLLQQLQANSFTEALLFLQGLTGLIFTGSLLQDFIKEEIKHDLYFIDPVNRVSLSTSSEGEQKKALLYHLLRQAPAYLILDELFDNLDSNIQREVIEAITTAASNTIIIQLFGRRQDLLPFIENVLILEHKKLSPVDKNFTIQNEYNRSASLLIPPAMETISGVGDPLIKMTNINVHYEERCILKDISWQIKKGEYWQLKGPNGSGKTTLLSMISGDNPKAYLQDITLFGYQKGKGESVWDIKKNIGYFSQAMMRFFERYDSAENMIAGGMSDTIGLYQQASGSVIQLANEWLKILGLHQQNKKMFVHFSPGHQRMILIARAMIKHPPLLILDEPTAGLNDADAALIVSLINKIAAETTTAVIFVSHRNEPGLQPAFVLELLPDVNGSAGRVTALK